MRSWQENAGCVHTVIINTNTSVPARFTAVLTGAVAGLKGGEAKRLFDAVYSVATQAFGSDALAFSDWLAPAHTQIYRIGDNCSDTLTWRTAIGRSGEERMSQPRERKGDVGEGGSRGFAARGPPGRGQWAVFLALVIPPTRAMGRPRAGIHRKCIS